jgi:predicted DNA-binding transcriptional regulator YafY
LCEILVGKEKPMYHPASRLLTLLELLQATPMLTGGELARRLEVDARTVRRYVRILQDMGIPIVAMPGRAGGYQLRPGFKLPPLMLSDDEAVAVTLGLLVVERLGLDGGTAASAGALAKIQRVLPAALREQAGAVTRALVLDLARIPGEVSWSVLATLARAVEAQHQAHIRYQSAADVVTEREIDPYGVVFTGGHWYGVGHCHLRGDLRTFRLDRIQAATLLPGTFTRPPGFDSHAYLVRAIAAIPDVWEVSVLLELELAEVQRRVPPTLAELEVVPPYVRLRAAVDDLAMVARLLAGLGCTFMIERPEELRDAVKVLAVTLLRAAEA